MSDTSIVLFLISDEGAAATYQKAFDEYNLAPVFVSTLEAAQEKLEEKKSPQVFLMDMGSVDFEQAAAMQLRLAKNYSAHGILRIVLSGQINGRVLALHHDAGIQRVISKGTPPRGLAGQISSIVSANKNISDLQKQVYKLTVAPSEYSQEEVDDLVGQAFRQYPHDARVKIEYGNLCARTDKMDLAQGIARELLKADAANVRAMNLMARCLLKAGQFIEAIKFFNQADSLSPDNPDRLCELGDAYYNNGELDTAKGYFDRAVKIAPGLKEAHQKLGEISMQQGNEQEAFEILAGGLSEEEAASYFNNAGVMAVKQDNLLKGMSLYNTALGCLKTNKFKTRILFNLALAYKKNKDLPTAIEKFEEILKIEPDYEKAKLQIAATKKAMQQSKAS